MTTEAGPPPPSAPGALWHPPGSVELFPDRPTQTIVVRNTADRAIQVGSHVHFAQTNPGLDFDREAAIGWRLAVPAGTSVRFEPGIEREVTLVPLGGARVVPGLRRDLPAPPGPAATSPPHPSPGSTGDRPERERSTAEADPRQTP
jgi:urease subunit beta